MTLRERIQAVLAGEEPDRSPYSFWYHFRTLEWFPPQLHAEYRAPAPPKVLQEYVERMSQAESEFWHRYQPDILKVMHDIPYEVSPELPVIHSPSEWARLPRLNPQEGYFGAQLAMLRRLRTLVPLEVPIVETLFNAFYYAEKLSDGKLIEHLAQDPDAVQQGLNILQANLVDYAHAVLEVCDGIYYAVNGAGTDSAPREVYERFFYAFDRQLLESIADAPLNILHLHGYGELYADLFADAPFAIACWSDRKCTLNLTEGKRLFGRPVMGGINERLIERMSREEIFLHAQEAVDHVGRRGFILAPGCAIPTHTNPELLLAIREFVLTR